MRIQFINIASITCLIGILYCSCRQSNEKNLLAKWKSIHLSNPKMDEQIAAMKTYIDTVGNQDASLRQQIDVDSLKAMLTQELNHALEEQKISLENTIMEFMPNGVVYTTSVSGVDSAMYHVEENTIVIDEAKLKGYGETMKFEILKLSRDSLRVKLIDYGDTSVVTMIPVKN